MTRKIIHIDADCFYAAIEMRDDASLRGRPMAVGGHSKRRGVISTCNYEARYFGIHSAMSSAHAMRLCPQLIIVPGHMDRYREASEAMREIFYDYTELVEPLSLDEAYLDVSECTRHQGSATLIAEEIRQRIFNKIHITVSAGVANCKFLAKIASDWKKPNGIFVISPNKVNEFLPTLSVKKLPGVGKVTTEKLKRIGIETCADVKNYNHLALCKTFGIFGQRLYELSKGIDDREVKPSRIRKSLSVERTYPEDINSGDACLERLPDLLSELFRRLEKISQPYKISKAFVKVKFNDFTSTTIERVGTSARIIDYRELLVAASKRKSLPVRLLGIGVRFLQENPEFMQLDFFDDR